MLREAGKARAADEETRRQELERLKEESRALEAREAARKLEIQVRREEADSGQLQGVCFIFVLLRVRFI